MSKTSFIRKGKERINLKEFHWSKDGRTVVTKSVNGTYQTWNSKTGKILALTDRKPDIDLKIPNKQTVLYTKDYSKITISRNGTTKEFKEFGNNSAFDTSNNGEMMAEGTGWGDASIKITNIKSGKSWFLDGHPSVIGGIAFSPDGKFLAVGGSDKVIYIFDAKSYDLIRKLTGHEKPINSLTFSPDGMTLISSGKNELIKIWNWQNGKFLQDVKDKADIFGFQEILFSADGKYFLTKSDRVEFRLWDAKTFKRIRNFKTTEKYESSSGFMTIGYDAVPLSSISFNKDGNRILSDHADESIRIWDTNKGNQIKTFKVCKKVSSAFFISNDEKILAYCDKEDEGSIKIFDVDSNRQVMKFDDENTGFIEIFSVSQSGTHFATSDIGGDVLLWDINKSKPIREFDIGFSGSDSISFSPDGKTLVVGGRNQNLFSYFIL